MQNMNKKEFLLNIMILNIACGTVFLFCSWLLGVEKGFESYLLEVATHLITPTKLILYSFLLILYATIIEYVLRALQSYFERKSSPTIAILIVVFLYSLSHARHGWSGCVYAIPIGLITAYGFMHWKDWRILALWHIMWDLTTLAVFIFLALLGHSPYSDAVSFTYKKLQHEQGRIVYIPQTGWIDLVHYWGTQRRVCQIYEQLLQKKTNIELFSTYVDVFTLKHTRTVELTVPVLPISDKQKAQILARKAMLEEEEWQENSGFWIGMRLSAYSEEDIYSIDQALQDIPENTSFWKDCPQKNDPLPHDFSLSATNTQEKWPSFQTFMTKGLSYSRE